MLRAALRSRSCVVPHPGQVHSRILRGLGPSLRPHAEQYCDDGYQRSTLTSVRPYSLALYSSIPTNVDNPASWIDLARLPRPRATTFSVSTHTVWCSRTRRVESWWWKSRRASATLACRRATLQRAFSWFLDPVRLRAMFRWERRSALSLARSQRGLSTFRPSDNAAKADRPRSIPTVASTAGSGASCTSTTNEAWYLPAPSSVTVTDDGAAGSGRDQQTFRSPTLGRDRRPSGSIRKRLLAVNRAAWSCRRFLNRGLRTLTFAFSPRALAALYSLSARK
jgi:hypothetical protein